MDISDFGTNVLNSYRTGQLNRRNDDEYKRNESARKLFGDAMQNKPDALSQLYGVDPQTAFQAQKMQAQMSADVAKVIHRGATLIKSAPEEQKPNIYMAVRSELARNPNAAQWVARMPEQYDAQTVGQSVDQIIAQAGLYQDEPATSQAPALLQSFDGMASRMGLKPGSPEYQQAARVWANLDPKAKAQVVESADGYNVATFGGGAPAVSSPIIAGGARGPVPQGQIGPVGTSGGNTLFTDSGMTPEKTPEGDSFAQTFASLTPAQRQQVTAMNAKGIDWRIANGQVIRDDMPAPSNNQLRPPPKTSAGNYQQLSAQEVKTLGLPAGTVAQRSADGKVDIISKPDAPNQMTELQRYKQDQSMQDKTKRMGAATATIDETLSRIDELEKHPGFKDLGSVYGDIATGVPFIRTEAKGAESKLEAIKGQIALATMAELKTLSSSGATGFGALSEKELALLQNSIDSLKTSVSFEDLQSNLANVKKRLQAMKDGIGKEAAAPAKPTIGKKDYSELF